MAFIQNDILGSKVSEDADDASNKKAAETLTSKDF
jgi:hypothetical protein